MECCIVILGMVASLIRLGLTGITGVLTLVPCINSWVCPICARFISMIMMVIQSVPCIVNYIEIAETAVGDLIAALGK